MEQNQETTKEKKFYTPNEWEAKRLAELPWETVITPKSGLTLDYILSTGNKRIISPLAEGRFTEAPIDFWRNGDKNKVVRATIGLVYGKDEETGEFVQTFNYHPVLMFEATLPNGKKQIVTYTDPIPDIDYDPNDFDEANARGNVLKGGYMLTQEDIYKLNETGSLGKTLEVKYETPTGGVETREYIVGLDPYAQKPTFVYVDVDKLTNKYLVVNQEGNHKTYEYRKDKNGNDLPMRAYIGKDAHDLTVKEALILLSGKPIVLEHTSKEGKACKFLFTLSAATCRVEKCVSRLRYKEEKKAMLAEAQQKLAIEGKAKRAAAAEAAKSQTQGQAPAKAVEQKPVAEQAAQKPETKKPTRNFRK